MLVLYIADIELWQIIIIIRILSVFKVHDKLEVKKWILCHRMNHCKKWLVLTLAN